jgi:3'-5' exoribonuclease
MYLGGIIMTKRKFSDGDIIKENLWLVTGSIRRTKQGEPYWMGTFKVDADTDLTAKLWNKNMVEKYKSLLVPGKPLCVEAKIESFNNEPQLTIISVKEANVEQFDTSILIKKSKVEKQELIKEFEKIASQVEDIDYKRLLETFRNDPLFEEYAKAPAAKMIHHPWLYGLLEHSLTLARAVIALSPIYPFLNKDLLIAGAFLHDVGKTMEISQDVGFEYTVDGQLMGHIYLGAKYVETLIDKIENFNNEKKKQIVHLILSHQGYIEDGFGSPVNPQTVEATFFHYLDNMDAKTRHIATAIEESENKKGFIRTKQPLNLRIYLGDEEDEYSTPEKKNLFE